MKMSQEAPRIAILNKQKMSFTKIKDRKVKQVLYRGGYQWEGDDIRKG
jgi:hypothetical protein